MRSAAYFGMCDSEHKLKRFDPAIDDCTKALTYDPNHPYAHYVLGLAYFKKAVGANSLAELDPALRHFRSALEINADMVEATYAKQNIALIEKVRAAQSAQNIQKN